MIVQIRHIVVLGLIIALSACTAAPVRPVPPDRPDCAAPGTEVPVDGGLGGTGLTPPEDCPPDAN